MYIEDIKFLEKSCYMWTFLYKPRNSKETNIE